MLGKGVVEKKEIIVLLMFCCCWFFLTNIFVFVLSYYVKKVIRSKAAMRNFNEFVIRKISEC